MPDELSTAGRQAAYAYVLGQYLGDGYLARHRRDVYRLRVVCCNSWPLVIDRLCESIRVVMPRNSIGFVRKVGCVEVGQYSKRWAPLLPQHGAGLKHLRTLRLTEWQREIVFGDGVEDFVCGLLHSDGCRSQNKVTVRGKRYEYPRYFFSNRSADIHAMFKESLSVLGIRSTRSGWNRSVARKADVRLLDEIGASKGSPWPIATQMSCPGRDSNPHDREVNGF